MTLTAGMKHPQPEALEALSEFQKIRGTLFGVLIVRILLFRVLYWGPLFFGNSLVNHKLPHPEVFNLF